MYTVHTVRFGQMAKWRLRNQLLDFLISDYFVAGHYLTLKLELTQSYRPYLTLPLPDKAGSGKAGKAAPGKVA